MSSDHAGPGQRYWLLVGSEPSGPYTAEQVHAKLAAREVTWETRACRLGDGTWRPLFQTPGFGPSPAPEDIPTVLPVPPEEEAPRRSGAAARPVQSPAGIRGPHLAATTGSAASGDKSRSWAGWVSAAGALLVGIILAVARNSGPAFKQVTSLPPPTTPASTGASPSPARSVSAPPAPPSYWNIPQAVGRINVLATDGTATLQALAAQLPPDELQALGLSVLVTGVDVYGVKVRIRNTGTAPVRIFPGNLRVHYGQETVGVGTAHHPLFLQPCVLQPGDSVEGLVMYQAAVDVGAVIRLQGTSFSYDDPSVTVTYGP